MKMVFRPALQNEIPEIAALYRSVIGLPGCTWNEFYPTLEDAQADFDAHGLYAAFSDEKLIGAVSVVPENELDDQPFWQYAVPHREIARVVVAREYQGNGLSYQMLTRLFELLRDQGCRSVRLLVAKCNPAARRTYQKLGFLFSGECRLYGNHYDACELPLPPKP